MKLFELRKTIQFVIYFLYILLFFLLFRQTGYVGIAYLQTALGWYLLFQLLINGKISETICRLLKSKVYKSATIKDLRVFLCRSLLVQGIIGLAGTIFLYFASYMKAVNIPGISIELPASILASSIFFRALSSILSGILTVNGRENLPIINKSLRLILTGMITFIILPGFCSYGSKIGALLAQNNIPSMYGIIAFCIAVTVAEFVVLLFNVVLAFTKKEEIFGGRHDGEGLHFSFGTYLYHLFINRLETPDQRFMLFFPIFAGYILSATDRGNNSSDISSFGQYGMGLCFPIICILLPSVLYTRIVARRTLAYCKKGESRLNRKLFQTGIKLTLITGLLCMILLLGLSKPISVLLAQELSEPLIALYRHSVPVLFIIPLYSYLTEILLLQNSSRIVIIQYLLSFMGAALFTILSVKLGGDSITFSLWGYFITFVFSTIIDFFILSGQFRYHLDFLRLLFIPAIAAALSCSIVKLLSLVALPHLGPLAVIILGTILLTAIYWVILLLLRVVHESDLDNAPFGRFLYAIGQILRVY